MREDPDSKKIRPEDYNPLPSPVTEDEFLLIVENMMPGAATRNKQRQIAARVIAREKQLMPLSDEVIDLR